jgi:hypothetical protein
MSYKNKNLEEQINKLSSLLEDFREATENIEPILEEIYDEMDDGSIRSHPALPENQKIEITQHHIITLREAIENYGGTNSQRAMLADVMRLVEAC